MKEQRDYKCNLYQPTYQHIKEHGKNVSPKFHECLSRLNVLNCKISRNQPNIFDVFPKYSLSLYKIQRSESNWEIVMKAKLSEMYQNKLLTTVLRTN